MQIELRDELQKVSKVASISNEVFGDVEILQGKSNYFLAKRLNPVSAQQVERLYKTRDFLFDNGCPFLQEFYCLTELFGEKYVLFQYYDYSLNDLLESNSRNQVFLPEESLTKLFFGAGQVLEFFRANDTYYPLVSQKTVFCSVEGQLKLLHPLLFEGFLRNVDGLKDPCLLMYTFDQCYGQLAAVVLEQASLSKVGGADKTTSAEKAREALLSVLKRYSFGFFNCLRKFDFNVLPTNFNESLLANLNAFQNYFSPGERGVQKYLIGLKSSLPAQQARPSLGQSANNLPQSRSARHSQLSETQRKLYIFESNEKEDSRSAISRKKADFERREFSAPQDTFGSQISPFKKREHPDIPLQYGGEVGQQMARPGFEASMFNSAPIERNIANEFYTASSNTLTNQANDKLIAQSDSKIKDSYFLKDKSAQPSGRYTIRTHASDYFPNHEVVVDQVQLPTPQHQQPPEQTLFNPTDFFTGSPGQPKRAVYASPQQNGEHVSNHEISQNSFFNDIFVPSEPRVEENQQNPNIYVYDQSSDMYPEQLGRVPVPDYITRINETPEHARSPPNGDSRLEMKTVSYDQLAPKVEFSFKKALGDIYAKEYNKSNPAPRTIKSQIDEILRNQTLVESLEVNNAQSKNVSKIERGPESQLGIARVPATTLNDFPETFAVTYYAPY